MLSFHNDMYTVLHARTCAQGRGEGRGSGGRGGGERGMAAARAHRATLRHCVAGHPSPFHFSRGAEQIAAVFYSVSVRQVRGCRGGWRGGRRGAFFSARPAPPRLHTVLLLLPARSSHTRPRALHSRRKVSIV